jgi:hypothetical protein
MQTKMVEKVDEFTEQKCRPVGYEQQTQAFDGKERIRSIGERIPGTAR